MNATGNVAVAARNKAQRDKLLITEDPSLMFLIVKVARDQTQPGFLLARSRGRKMREPGNEVVVTSLQQQCRPNCQNNLSTTAS